MLNIREMIAGEPARLRWVYRYQTCRVRHPESVAEHSWFACFYCLMIAHWLLDNGTQVNTSDLMVRAVIHDVEEAITGDFPRNFKHASTERHEMLERAGREAMVEILDKMTYPNNALFDAWSSAKNEDVEGYVVEFADFLAVLGFLLQEGQGEGNGSIGVHVADMSIYYGKFQKEEYGFLRPLVDQAGGIMQELGIYDTAKIAEGARG